MRPMMRHDTEEFFVMLDGKVDFFIGGNETAEKLSAGQTLYLRTNVPHQVKLSAGCDFAKALVVYAKKQTDDTCSLPEK